MMHQPDLQWISMGISGLFLQQSHWPFTCLFDWKTAWVADFGVEPKVS